MNYLAHGHRFLESPWMLAGTAVPDWLSVLNRRVRARKKAARRFLLARDQRLVQIAAGIVAHHRDDDWFHRTRAFAELSLKFTAEIRDLLPPDRGLRPSFLGHIIVELLLDAELSRRNPQLLDEYYRVVDSLDLQYVAWAVDRIANGPALGLEQLIPRFSSEQFLYDYAEDAKLLFRLNNVMARVGLAEIPELLGDWLGSARKRVRQRADDLLTPGSLPMND